MIKAVIFDMDGLMFDTETLFSIVQGEVARKRGKEFTLEIQGKMMGQKPLHAIEIMLKELDIDEDAQKVTDERDAGYVQLLHTDSQPMPGLFALLDFLEAHNIRKCIATGSHREWVDILLKRFNLEHRFEFIVTGAEVPLGKPNPAIYLKAVEKLGLPASECLVLEDAENGVRAAKAADCIAVAVPSRFTQSHDFSTANFTVISLDDKKLFDICTHI